MPSPPFTLVALSLSHISSHVLLPILHTFLLHHLSFPYPATLLLLHHLTIAISLLYWTIFGLFHPRPHLPPLALLFALLPASLLPLLTLHRTSLAVAHASRLLAAALSHLLRTRTPSAVPPLLASLFATVSLARLDHLPVLLPLLTSLSLSLYTHLYHLHAPTLPHTYLQLHLPLHLLLPLLLLPLLPLLDDLRPDSPVSLLNLAWLDPAAIPLLAASLLSFFAFVAHRAAQQALHPASFAANEHLVNCAVFAAHFLVFAAPFDGRRAGAVAVIVAVDACVRRSEAPGMRWKNSAAGVWDAQDRADEEVGWSEEDLDGDLTEERDVGDGAAWGSAWNGSGVHRIVAELHRVF